MGTTRAGGARAVVQAASALPGRFWHGMRRLWRTSLQFRVVLTTMLIGTVLTVVLQSFLYGRIADGLVSARMEVAQNDAAQSASDLRRMLEEHEQAGAEEFLTSTHDLIGRQEENENREITLTRSPSNRFGPAAIVAFDTHYPPELIPEALSKAIAEDPTHQQVQIVPLPVADDPEVPAVVVGTQIVIPEAGPYELYYIYPMAREERLMAVIWRVFLVGSVALVATLGLVAFIVTRLVVDPLRQASEVAGRLSDGHLNERMLVRGEDDIARLATAFNDMAEHLQQQIRQLEDLSRVQQRFVSDVSHELRTPLTTIRMASEVIHDQREGFDPVVSRSTELLYAQVQRFEELLADLLEISRFDAGGTVLELERVDLRDIVGRAIVGAEQLAVARGSEIVVVGDEVPRVAAVEPRRVERILRNLLVNAIEHGEGRPVTIELGSDEGDRDGEGEGEGEDGVVAVVVADQGIGLKPGQAELVFNRFWRADPSRKRTTGGTGLGLAIALEDAHLHHGRLQAWGEEGRGARFRLTLPRAENGVVGESPLPLAPPSSVASAASVASGDAVAGAPAAGGLTAGGLGESGGPDSDQDLDATPSGRTR